MGNRPSILSHTFNNVSKTFNDLGFCFPDLQKDQIVKWSIYLREALYSPRFKSDVYPDNRENIVSQEKEKIKSRKLKYNLLKDLHNPLFDFPQGDVIRHSLQLIELSKRYQFDDNIVKQNMLIKAFLIHDLSEVEMYDRSQAQGPKPFEFKEQENIVGKTEIEKIFDGFDDLKNDFLNIYEELQNKDGWLYTTLKIYEEMSHIEGLYQLYHIKKINKENMMSGIKKHTDILGSKNKPIKDYIIRYLNHLNQKLSDL